MERRTRGSRPYLHDELSRTFAREIVKPVYDRILLVRESESSCGGVRRYRRDQVISNRVPGPVSNRVKTKAVSGLRRLRSAIRPFSQLVPIILAPPNVTDCQYYWLG
jgi:hypothetical protein